MGAKSLAGLNWAYTQGLVEVLNGAAVDAMPPAPADVTQVHAIKHAPVPARHLGTFEKRGRWSSATFIGVGTQNRSDLV